MLSLRSRLSRFARSPQGRKLFAEAKRTASDPENRRKIESLRRRLTKRR